MPLLVKEEVSDNDGLPVLQNDPLGDGEALSQEEMVALAVLVGENKAEPLDDPDTDCDSEPVSLTDAVPEMDADSEGEPLSVPDTVTEPEPDEEPDAVTEREAV